MEVVKEKLKVLRTKLDSIPVLQKAEVSNAMQKNRILWARVEPVLDSTY